MLLCHITSVAMVNAEKLDKTGLSKMRGKFPLQEALMEWPCATGPCAFDPSSPNLPRSSRAPDDGHFLLGTEDGEATALTSHEPTDTNGS